MLRWKTGIPQNMIMSSPLSTQHAAGITVISPSKVEFLVRSIYVRWISILQYRICPDLCHSNTSFTTVPCNWVNLEITRKNDRLRNDWKHVTVAAVSSNEARFNFSHIPEPYVHTASNTSTSTIHQWISTFFDGQDFRTDLIHLKFRCTFYCRRTKSSSSGCTPNEYWYSR